jgi:sugar-phosphatase
MNVKAMENALRPYFHRLRETRDIRIPGSIALLERLAESHPVAIVSGSPRTDLDDAVQRLGIGDRLSFTLAAEDYAPGKPHPAGYLAAARRLDLPPEKCLVFEDSAAGVRSARDAGMACVALQRDGAPAQDTTGADLVLADLAAFRVEEWV